jgi:hypothetical protein
MPHQNRVTPYGEIVASPLRGRWLGNRGCLHVATDIVRPWNGKRWITCVLEYKGWVAPKWEPGRWTALFFHDEAVALAAGHRPCALCRRADYRRYRAAVGLTGAEEIDARLHADRLDGRVKRLHTMPWRDVPVGAFVEVGEAPMLVAPGGLRAWSNDRGYVRVVERPEAGDATVITPATNVAAIAAGYELQIGNDAEGE